MKITKTRLVEIIKEEIENLEEFRISNMLKGLGTPSTRGGYKAAGERGPESKEALADRVDDEIAKLSSKGRQIASVATMDANLHSDKKDAAQDQAIQSLDSRFNTLDSPGEIGDSLLGDKEFVNQVLAKVRNQIDQNLDQRLNYYTTRTDHGQLKKQIKDLKDPKFIDMLIAKINQRQQKAGE